MGEAAVYLYYPETKTSERHQKVPDREDASFAARVEVTRVMRIESRRRNILEPRQVWEVQEYREKVRDILDHSFPR